MPRGSKDKYTTKQKRKAEHIETSYEEKGVPKEEAQARAWATVNKQSGGGERQGGSGRTTLGAQKAQARKASARKAAANRRNVARNTTLSDETKEQLMRRARARKIHGRSTMRKQELIDALRKAS